MPGYVDNKDAIQKRLRRIEGQVRGLQRMVDEDKYCIEVLDQISAVTKRAPGRRHGIARRPSVALRGRRVDAGRRGRARRWRRRPRRSRDWCGHDSRPRAITLADIGDSFREAFFMFWVTLWALILGFSLSGGGAGVRLEGRDAARDG